ncbi:MAG: hypothetical protein JWN51_2378 [Phycisphaerales bacterium]|nr:hypothetical protein [Phycisphaerales bacterium]
MNLICLQLDITWHDKSANHDKVRALLDRTDVPAGSLIVLPEMFATGFSMDVAAIADEVTHETEGFLHAVAAERNVAVLGGLVTRGPDGKGRNEAVVVFPDGRETVRYQKIHPFTLGGESEHYRPGHDIILFEWQGFQIAPFVCYDLRFPEIFRIAAMRGAHVMTVIANWPAAREEHWNTLLKARAIENQCYVAGVNRCGKDPALAYPGRTQILGPRGGEIVAVDTKEGAIAAPLHLQALLDYRTQFPFLQDARPQFLPGQLDDPQGGIAAKTRRGEGRREEEKKNIATDADG